MWSILVAVLAISYGYARSRRGSGVEINHVTTFTLGFLFYWLLPTLMGSVASLDPDNIAISKWSDYFNYIPNQRITAYIISLLVLYLSFACGDFLGKYPIFHRKKSEPGRTFQAPLWRAEWFAVLLLFLFMLTRLHGLLFSNYSNETDSASLARGTLTAISLVLFSISWQQALHGRWVYMKVYFICALALLAMGERLYFASSILSLLAYASRRKPIRKRTLLFFASAAAVGMGLLAAFRIRSEVSPLSILLNVAFESLFTSFSLMSYLHANAIAWIHAPKYLMVDMINLVPSAFMDKTAFTHLALTESNYEISSPLGAMNSWVSFNVNFGVIGTAGFLFLMGYLFRRNEGLSVSYLMLTGFLAFTFFRDPFSVSLVKNMLEFSILIPILLEQISEFIVFSTRQQSTTTST